MNKHIPKQSTVMMAALMASVLATFLPLPVFAQSGAGAAVGQAAPKFANPKALESGYVSGSDYLGKGWLLLDFFATDCAPCLKELPFLEKILERYAKSDGAGAKLRGILFDQDADPNVGAAFFRDRRSPFIVAQDSYNTTYRKYKGPGDTVELPLTVVVAPDGKAAFVASGGSDATMKALEAFIAANVK